VSVVLPCCFVTTISQWVTATDVNAANGSLCVRQIFSAIGELISASSKSNSCIARRALMVSVLNRGLQLERSAQVQR
jgi:hypothetical protein